MASEGKFIRRSKVLRNPLGGGQAGVLRESGLIDAKKGGILDAWSLGLENRVLWWRKDRGRPMEFTNLIYDETMQATIFGFKAKHGTGNRAEM